MNEAYGTIDTSDPLLGFLARLHAGHFSLFSRRHAKCAQPWQCLHPSASSPGTTSTRQNEQRGRFTFTAMDPFWREDSSTASRLALDEQIESLPRRSERSRSEVTHAEHDRLVGHLGSVHD